LKKKKHFQFFFLGEAQKQPFRVKKKNHERCANEALAFVLVDAALLKRALSWLITLDSRQQSCIILELSATGSRKEYQRRAPIVQLAVLSEKDKEGNI
jgi:hypothetical protein